MKQRIFSHFQDYLIQYISHHYQYLLYCNSSQYILSTYNSQHNNNNNNVSRIRTLHLLVGKPFPDLNEFCIHLLYRGIARQTMHIAKRALPITIDILLKIYNHIDLSDVKHATIWSLFLFAFFLMARKSNLVPDSVHKFDSKKQLTREKIVLIY
jgi:hypothetical protein